jgi:putative glutamine amidotransferase
MQPPLAPLIGVIADHKRIGSSDRSDSARTFVGVYATYLRCLAAAGALPVVVPLDVPPATLRGIFDRLDGIMFTGGGDIDPAIYGQTLLNATVRGIKPERDRTEIQISQWAATEDVPLLGICRGHQVVNVALGGDLIMDIPSQIRTDLQHDTFGEYPLDYRAHEISIAQGSLLERILGSTVATTNSRHHQAVQHTGRGMVVTAQSPDGVIEATELPGSRFFLTVQWHPENLCDDDSAMQSLFDALVDAARAYMESRLEQNPAQGR